jgi:hypothetical protein
MRIVGLVVEVMVMFVIWNGGTIELWKKRKGFWVYMIDGMILEIEIEKQKVRFWMQVLM